MFFIKVSDAAAITKAVSKFTSTVIFSKDGSVFIDSERHRFAIATAHHLNHDIQIASPQQFSRALKNAISIDTSPNATIVFRYEEALDRDGHRIFGQLDTLCFANSSFANDLTTIEFKSKCSQCELTSRFDFSQSLIAGMELESGLFKSLQDDFSLVLSDHHVFIDDEYKKIKVQVDKIHWKGRIHLQDFSNKKLGSLIKVKSKEKVQLELHKVEETVFVQVKYGDLVFVSKAFSIVSVEKQRLAEFWTAKSTGRYEPSKALVGHYQAVTPMTKALESKFLQEKERQGIALAGYNQALIPSTLLDRHVLSEERMDERTQMIASSLNSILRSETFYNLGRVQVGKYCKPSEREAMKPYIEAFAESTRKLDNTVNAFDLMKKLLAGGVTYDSILIELVASMRKDKAERKIHYPFGEPVECVVLDPFAHLDDEQIDQLYSTKESVIATPNPFLHGKTFLRECVKSNLKAA
ncbi:hypothetical protein [Vibrio harveyi]|uniref:hypothetical protein n=1 Tax=Vibrio harveyi TaxID=669 RepID=UPI003CEB7FA8